MINPKDFWNKNAPGYAKRPVRNEADYRKKLAMTQAYFQPDWEVLEFACGTGTTAIHHSSLVKHIVATDLSDGMLEIARKKADDTGVQNISFQQGTLETLPLKPESFNAVLGLNILHLLEDIEGTSEKVYSLLKPGGIFVSSTALVGNLNVFFHVFISVLQWIGKAPYVNRFSKPELVSALTNAGFTIEQEWQPGKDSVFIVARKSAT
ncbi:class I SAM-dependent methyltransferase [Parasalinivibrio latis]|uniref:class I SAM-dependent methyltransferase n=1 Tax=Parasalinivibrio latis TaxID=2952610 RepID=UPI0030E057AF